MIQVLHAERTENDITADVTFVGPSFGMAVLDLHLKRNGTDWKIVGPRHFTKEGVVPTVVLTKDTYPELMRALGEALGG